MTFNELRKQLSFAGESPEDIEQADTARLLSMARAANIDPEDLIPLEDMMDELEQYSEAAGFVDYRNRVLNGMSEDEIIREIRKTSDQENTENKQNLFPFSFKV